MLWPLGDALSSRGNPPYGQYGTRPIQSCIFPNNNDPSLHQSTPRFLACSLFCSRFCQSGVGIVIFRVITPKISQEVSRLQTMDPLLNDIIDCRDRVLATLRVPSTSLYNSLMLDRSHDDGQGMGKVAGDSSLFAECICRKSSLILSSKFCCLTWGFELTASNPVPWSLTV